MALVGVQFPRIKARPDQDALLFLALADGQDKIVPGYGDELKTRTTGLNVYVGNGGAVIQGHLVYNDKEEGLTVAANTTGFISITIDLTATNTSSGTAGTPDYVAVNNQIRLEVVTELLQQDLKNGGQIYTFPIARYISNGTTVTLTQMKPAYYPLWFGKMEVV